MLTGTVLLSESRTLDSGASIPIRLSGLSCDRCGAEAWASEQPSVRVRGAGFSRGPVLPAAVGSLERS